METIKIKYFNGATKLHKLDIGDWIDLRANEDVFIGVGEYKLIKLGVAMELPKGYEAHVVPRSSTFKTWGIIQTNHMGVIDNLYCGDNDEWRFPAFCLQAKDTIEHGTFIKKGDRICQFRIMESQPPIKFIEVDKLDGKDRGGIGSSGKN